MSLFSDARNRDLDLDLFLYARYRCPRPDPVVSSSDISCRHLECYLADADVGRATALYPTTNLRLFEDSIH